MVWEYIKSDLYRFTGRISTRAFIRNYVRNRSFRYMFWFRLCRSGLFPVRLIAILMHDRLSKKFQIQLPRSTKVGYGLYLSHHMCVVVNETATIGDNCNLHQFTTIGSQNNNAATIGDNVWIGPGVSVVENVSIGDNCVVGAGSVVVRDIEANSIAVGAPAKRVNAIEENPYCNNRWPVRARKAASA